MSYASETTAEPGSVSNLSDAVHGGNSSGGSAASSSGGSQQDGDLGGDGSESESYVEVEQLGDDGASGAAGFASASPALSPPCSNKVVRHVTKRTLITLHQRSVLEEYYRNGMTSASQQLSELHEIVAAKTGLDIVVVRNWIRNRRRPNAAKMAERMAEKIAAYTIPVTSSLPSSQLPTLIPSNPTSLTPLPTLPHTVVVTTTNHHNLTTPGLIRVTDHLPHPPVIPFSSIPQLPEPKRICLDPTPHNHTSSPTSVTPHSSPLLVKVRVSGSGESDFVEVEVAPPTYHTLVSACCEELELAVSDVAKIRKLPNVLVRKDRDVQRMADGQELEVVMKGEGSSGGGIVGVISPPAAAASYPATSVLTVNPFAPPSAAMLALSNQAVQVQRGSPVNATATVTSEGLMTLKSSDENGSTTPNHITGVTNDSGDIQNHAHSHAHSTSTVNGL